MDLDRAAWFMAGLFIGNFLDTFTTITLLFIWVVIRNQAMPLCLGGFYPQNVLANFFQLLNVWVSLIIPSRIFPNKSNSKNLPDQTSPPQIQNNLARFISPKAQIDESGLIIENRFVQRTNLQEINSPKPITFLVRPIVTPNPTNYSHKQFQLLVPPRVDLIDPASYARSNNAKLKLIIP